MTSSSILDTIRTISGGTSANDEDGHDATVRRPDAVGWYRDPYDASMQRFWDGTAWSAAITAGTAATADSVPRLLAG